MFCLQIWIMHRPNTHNDMTQICMTFNHNRLRLVSSFSWESWLKCNLWEDTEEITAVRGTVVLNLHLEALPFANGTINCLNSAWLGSITLMHVDELVIGTVSFKCCLSRPCFWPEQDDVQGRPDSTLETVRCHALLDGLASRSCPERSLIHCLISGQKAKRRRADEERLCDR